MQLLYFVFGILFIQHILPLLSEVRELILAIIEAKKVKFNKIINKATIKMRKDIANAEKEEDPLPMSQIGFCSSDYKE